MPGRVGLAIPAAAQGARKEGTDPKSWDSWGSFPAPDSRHPGDAGSNIGVRGQAEGKERGRGADRCEPAGETPATRPPGKGPPSPTLFPHTRLTGSQRGTAACSQSHSFSGRTHCPVPLGAPLPASGGARTPWQGDTSCLGPFSLSVRDSESLCPVT